MRPNILCGIAALALAGACGSDPKPIANVDTGGGIDPETHSLRADISVAPLSRDEIASLRRRPTGMRAADVDAGLHLPTRARWDAFLAGDTTALVGAERRGLILFARAGCADCHDGLYVGGGGYRRLGTAIPVGALVDSGRYVVTRDPEDVFVYRVASLRNVQLTSPYLHDGSVRMLGQAVRLMGRHQLGVDLTEDQVSDIRAYLGTLSGQFPDRPARGGAR